jgi:hypothetical protein
VVVVGGAAGSGAALDTVCTEFSFGCRAGWPVNTQRAVVHREPVGESTNLNRFR